MIFNNRKYRKTVSQIFLFSGLMILASLFLKIQGRLGETSFYFILLALVLLLIFTVFRAAYFEYNSEGDNYFCFRSGRYIMHLFKIKKRKYKVEKHALKKYKLKNYGIYKAVELYVINSEKGKLQKLSFDITFLNEKKTNLLKQSLNKVVKRKSEAFNYS